jgi:ABC-type uncharacterized transport system permease subunit
VSWPVDKYWFLASVILYGVCSVHFLFLWRKGFRQDDRLSYLLLSVAFVCHTLAMVKRGFSLSRCPVNNLYEAIAFVMWTIVACYLVVGLWPRMRFLGAFASPILFSVGVFALFPELDGTGTHPDLAKGWLSFHAAVILLAYGAFGLASVAGLMYLTQEHDLKFRKVRAVLALLPPIERLERVIMQMLVVGLTLLTIGLAVGSINVRGRHEDFTMWDAKVVWSGVVWLLYLALLVRHWVFAQGGRRFALGAVVSFAFVLLTFWGTNMMSPIHQE